ncbi:hypothetical protein AAV94_14165 [Lampropedia cohaerens]|uniref:HTH lysR-type domain-containing protein n=1 Tax=Lampropedia cohaerens TaxID=1610491 RepID=A0A0U1PWN0_9BURK|nr:LysR family transcriptional regulator [Lampropedia cohaerens]KKW66866.1 hypothetical protein AAV94_14165 [Lampropedia cohaerens]
MSQHQILADRLDWNLLRAFIAIVEERSITRAADRLHLTQPAVSLALKRLEQCLQRRLVIRGAGAFEVTAAGEAVYREAIKISAGLALLNASLEEAEEDLSGHVHLMLVSRVPSPDLDDILAQFHARHPRVSFELEVSTSAEIHHALLHRRAGIGICLMSAPVLGLQRRVFSRQSYAFYCGRSHPLFGQNNLPVDALRDEPIISFTSEQLNDSLAPIAQFRRTHALRGKTIGISGTLDEVIRMVRCGLGIACLPEHAASMEVQAGQLFQLPPYEGVAQMESYLCWPEQGTLSASEEAFLTHARAHLRRQQARA